MTVITRTNAQAAADVIRTEVTEGANTPTRVGGLMRDLTDSLPFVDEGYRAEYFVDAASTHTSEFGTKVFPFKTITAAFAAAVAAGLTRAVVVLPTGITHVETWSYPSGGGYWTVEGRGDGGGGRTSITGSCVCTSVTQSVFTLKNVNLSGTITGVATSASGNFLYLRDSAITGNVTPTVSGSGQWFGNFIGSGTNFFSFGGSCAGLVTFPAQTQLFTENWYLGGAVVAGSGPSFFRSTRFQTGSISGSSLALGFQDCEFGVATTITGTGGSPLDVTADGHSAAGLAQVGLTLSNAKLKTKNANLSVTRTVTGAITASEFNGSSSAHTPPGLYRASGDLTQLIAGTSGNTDLKVTYTDMTGTLVTATICTIATNAVAGTKAGSAVTFQHNGASSITYSVPLSGTAGSLSCALRAALRRDD